jgi:hypothetical protein
MVSALLVRYEDRPLEIALRPLQYLPFVSLELVGRWKLPLAVWQTTSERGLASLACHSLGGQGGEQLSPPSGGLL